MALRQITRFALLFVTTASLCAVTASASESVRESGTRTTLVEAVPTASTSLARIHRVSAEQTPSGYPVPRFVSLKFGTVNARTGPSRDHSIAYQYQRRGLPLIVVAETEMWRKVRDISGDEAWVRKPALSGERTAILMSDAVLRTKPEIDARATARIEKGALVRLETCENGYCRIETRSGIRGFAPKSDLWGAQSF